MDTTEFHCAESGEGLRYPGFSVVFLQMFALNRHKGFDMAKAAASGLVTPMVKSIDRQIFVMDDKDRDGMSRFRLEGFDFSFTLDEPYQLTMSGHVHVEMLLLFGYIVSLSYRFVFDRNSCFLSEAACTDHIIALLSTHLSAEHWSRNSDDDETDINLEISNFIVTKLRISDEGVALEPSQTKPKSLDGCNRVFDQVSSLYKKFIMEQCSSYRRETAVSDRILDRLWRKSSRKNKMEDVEEANSSKDLHYAMVDIWESISHSREAGEADIFANNNPERMSEAEIVDHIREHHKEELIGLMTLYPEEWPYRDKEAYDEVCGENIAIDTDDLVLVNNNICTVIGTYGRRGMNSPVNWKEHLQERSNYHVSWPEYLCILEMVLAKKYIIDYVSDQLVNATLDFENKSSTELIGRNAEISIRLSRMILQLNIVKYSKFMSHKVMFDRTVARLGVEKNHEELIDLMGIVDNSLHNQSDYKALRSDFTLNFILALISVVSTFEILFQEINFPFLERHGVASGWLASVAVWFAAAAVCFGISLVILNTLKKVGAKIIRTIKKY